MKSELVTTPEGKKHLAGKVAVAFAAFVDLCVAGVIASLLSETADQLHFPLPQASKVILMIVIWGYVLLAHRGTVPSLGNWITSIRRYRYDQIDEYVGSGVLFVREQTSRFVFLVRIIVVVLVFLVVRTIAMAI